MQDECYRCGYDLRGIGDDQPCPECGLLALRSRRESDELHNTRPNWLRTIATGTWLILVALLIAGAWPFVYTTVVQYALRTLWRRGGIAIWWYVQPLEWLVGFALAGGVFVVGVRLLTAAEGYPPADRHDHARRLWLRILSLVPLLCLVFQYIENVNYWRSLAMRSFTGLWTPLQVVAVVLILLATIPMTPLLFFQLRGMAKRARSAHLAEHCAIVGIGTSGALIYVGAVILVVNNARALGLDNYWIERSRSWLVVMLVLGTAAGLFLLWSLYLLTRFAIAFRRAARQLRRTSARDDRSADAAVG